MDNIELSSDEVDQLDLGDAEQGDTVTITCTVAETSESGLTLEPQSATVQGQGEGGEGDEGGSGAAPEGGGEDETPPAGVKNPAVAALIISRRKK